MNRNPQKNQESVKKAQIIKWKRKALRRASVRRRKTEVKVKIEVEAKVKVTIKNRVKLMEGTRAVVFKQEINRLAIQMNLSFIHLNLGLIQRFPNIKDQSQKILTFQNIQNIPRIQRRWKKVNQNKNLIQIHTIYAKSGHNKF